MSDPLSPQVGNELGATADVGGRPAANNNNNNGKQDPGDLKPEVLRELVADSDAGELPFNQNQNQTAASPSKPTT